MLQFREYVRAHLNHHTSQMVKSSRYKISSHLHVLHVLAGIYLSLHFQFPLNWISRLVQLVSITTLSTCMHVSVPSQSSKGFLWCPVRITSQSFVEMVSSVALEDPSHLHITIATIYFNYICTVNRKLFKFPFLRKTTWSGTLSICSHWCGKLCQDKLVRVPDRRHPLALRKSIWIRVQKVVVGFIWARVRKNTANWPWLQSNFQRFSTHWVMLCTR